MSKEEIVARILEYMIDEGRDCPEDYADVEPVDLDYATNTMLEDFRAFENDLIDEDEEKIGDQVTPELLMEVFNCHLKAMKRELHIEQITEYFEESDDSIVYAYSYLPECHPKNAPVDMAPLDFFTDELAEGGFYFDTVKKTFTKEEILRIFSASIQHIDFNADYICFIDTGNEQYMKTFNCADEVVDPEEFATAIVDNPSGFRYFVEEVLEDEEAVKEVFKCTREEVLKGVDING